MIPAPRPAADDNDAELHAEVARRFAAQADYARTQAAFLGTIQTAGSNQAAAFEAGVAAIIEQHAAAARTASTAPEATR